MTDPKILRLYLEGKLLKAAQAGTHNFLSQLISVTEAAGFQTELCNRGFGDRVASGFRDGYALFHMQEPTTDRGLTFRKVYHGPFWAIESTNKRWDWRVAQKSFDPEKIDPDKAKTFYSRWQQRMFKGATDTISQDGFVYVPLQGKLTERRSFQMASPIEMLMAVLHHDPNRRVIATLHPNETYTREEQRRLTHMQDRFANLSIQTGGMVPLLQRCDYVVSQNSGVAFNGYFFGKPCVLFGKIDFHHIALNVGAMGVANAFAQVKEHQPDYERYIYWFWQKNCINSGRSYAEKQIAKALRRGGWPV
jgi:hypothetical protein